jgi:hypothetical protein
MGKSMNESELRRYSDHLDQRAKRVRRAAVALAVMAVLLLAHSIWLLVVR